MTLPKSAWDRLPVGFALFDASYRLAAWNARFTVLRGYPRKLLNAGTPLESFLRFDAEQGEYGAGSSDELVRRQLATLKRRRRVDREHARPDGKCLRIVAERGPEGGLLVTCEDVTEARRAAERLRESDERHDFAMRAINEGTYDWDVEKGVVYYSERVYQVLGMSPTDFHTSQGWLERIHPEDRPRYLAATRAHFQHETDRFECDYRYRSRDGSWRWARQHGLAVRDAAGRALRLIGSTGDITELKGRERELEEQTAEQTATAEILKVISRSPTDIAPVLDAVAENAARLCDANDVVVMIKEGDVLRAVKSSGPFGERFGADFTIPITRGSAAGRSVIERATVQVANFELESDDEFPVGREHLRIYGNHGAMATPLLHGDAVLGAIAVLRRDVRPFSERQGALLRTFADQAAIAIENVRLFNETREALEQQTATAAILRVISESPGNLDPVFGTILERATELCGAQLGGVFMRDGERFHVIATRGEEPDLIARWKKAFATVAKPGPHSGLGRLLVEKRPIHIPDILEDGAYGEGDALRLQTAEILKARSFLAVPLLKGDAVIGAMVIYRREVRPFSDRQISLVRTFADQAVIAIEDVRLFNETKEALEQQTATAEILRVISSSPTDLAPVFDAVARSAARLCDAPDVVIVQVEGESMRFAASVGPFGQTFGPGFTIPITRGSVTGRAVLERRTIQVHDLAAESEEEYPVGKDLQRRHGHRTMVAAPLVVGEAALGAIAMLRTEVRPYSEKQLALLRTFADQAVIAIENVRLFNETKEALDHQRASAEVLQVISSSVADTKPVFDKILESCERLFEGRNVGITLVGDDGAVHLGPYRGPYRRELERMYPLPLSSASGSGSAILARRVMHYPDAEGGADVPEPVRRGSRTIGSKSIIFAPMLWEGRGIGAIFVAREAVGEFSEKEIALLKTFADQAVIAIQNAKLFHEIQDKSHQLEIANQHKSAFLANMSHELRTPLNAVIGFSEMLAARYFGDLTTKQAEYVNDIHGSGKHLLSLINDILDLSKIEAGRMELETGEFDLRAALDNALTLVRERAQRGGVALRLEADPGLGTIDGDERKLKQVVLNLLSNAVKFTPRGGAVSVTAKRVAGAAAIAVADTGVGIAPADQEAIFEVFRQVGTDVTRKREGTGLGLALTRRFVELHGGTIHVESAVGKGSTFTVTLPIRHGK
jgi:PAS domain S-box-containing protein